MVITPVNYVNLITSAPDIFSTLFYYIIAKLWLARILWFLALSSTI